MLRAGCSTVGVLVVHFVLPLDRLADVSLFVLLPVALTERQAEDPVVAPSVDAGAADAPRRPSSPSVAR